MQKVTEIVIFQGSTINLELFSDLDLWGPDDLIFGLRGHLRSRSPKMSFFIYFPRFSTLVNETWFVDILWGCRGHGHIEVDFRDL